MLEIVIADQRLAQITQDIHTRLKRTAEDILAIGQLLLEAQRLVPDGQWYHWLDDQLGITPRTAQRWMNCARQFAPGDLKSRISLTGLVLLTAPSVPEAAVQEVKRRMGDGEPFTTGGVESVIGKYRAFEALRVGTHLILQQFGTSPTGKPARTIQRSQVTSLGVVAVDALHHAAVEIDGVHHPIPDTEPEQFTHPIPDTPPPAQIITRTKTVQEGVKSQTNLRQGDHIADSFTKAKPLIMVDAELSDCNEHYAMFRVSVADTLEKGKIYRLIVQEM